MIKICMLIISAKSGQLGNRLLMFANFIAFAIENKFTVLNPAFEEYAEFFSSTSKDLLCSYPKTFLSIPGNNFLRKYYYILNKYLAGNSKANKLIINRKKTFNWSNYPILKDLKPGSLNFFQGWLFRDGWFVDDLPILRKHREEICTYFQPLDKYKINIDQLISNIRSQSEIIVGVHIRHGDYQQHQHGLYFYSVDEYLKVMQLVKEIFADKKITFLICSNEQQDESNFHNFSYVYGNNHLVEDMYSLAKCDYIIGPPSSYTMWASFYGNKPLYMIRDLNKELTIQDFVHFYQWRGIYHAHEDWSQSYWEWTH
jgi:Glycosyl transferase family 11